MKFSLPYRYDDDLFQHLLYSCVLVHSIPRHHNEHGEAHVLYGVAATDPLLALEQVKAAVEADRQGRKYFYLRRIPEHDQFSPVTGRGAGILKHRITVRGVWSDKDPLPRPLSDEK